MTDEREGLKEENRLMMVSDHQLRKMTKETVDSVLTSLGVDFDNPLEVQRDMQHLRDTRLAYDKIKTRGTMVALSILVTGFCGAAWLGLKELIKAG